MDLFEELCSLENLHRAYLAARRNKRYRKSILKFGFNLEENLLQLREELLSQTYKHGGYRQFFVYDSKKRLIKVAPFRDRVVHHALCNVIEYIFDKSFIFDSYACRRSKGTHRAIKRLDYFLSVLTAKKKGSNFYCLKCDVRKYFDNIDQRILAGFIREKITDERLLWLIDQIIYSERDSNGVGVPIGNLTSQLFANIYLDKLDKFIKHHLRVRYYVRYMDDFLILGDDKRLLSWFQSQIEVFLDSYLHLKFNYKRVAIFPIWLGIDFLGFINYRYYRLIRRTSIRRFLSRIRYLKKHHSDWRVVNEQYNSWLGHSVFADAWHLRLSLEKKFSVYFRF